MRRRDFVRHSAVAGVGAALGPGIPRFLRTPVHPSGGVHIDFDPGWRFVLDDVDDGARPGLDDQAWSAVALPHTARIENVVTGPPGSDTAQWQGICWYRKHFTLPAEGADRRAFLHFEAAMNVADVWLNGVHLGRHLGGWLPFAFDITDHVRVDGDNVLAVRLDNRDNPVTGPKPLAQLDFNSYHGLYRSVHLVLKDPLHITDPILADEPAGGGVFVTYPEVSADEATVRVRTQVKNAGDRPRIFQVRARLRDPRGVMVEEGWSAEVRLGAGDDIHLQRDLRVTTPALWSPGDPNLHDLVVEVVEDGRAVDAEETRIGIRRLEMTAEGFRINGERMFLRGTNRHQEYPWVGYALSDAAQYRDALAIKEAGFDFIRLSHYAHAPAFMDACDELGIAVMDCIPGWQYFNRDDPAFIEVQYRNCRDLVRRDRNHPCVILWEVSLNETGMPADFIRETHAIGHEEYPGDQCFTCGWMEGYDVFIQARQHGGCHEVEGRPCMVSEYGDWEYYAQNAGFNQDTWADLAPDDANSRQMRWAGERALLQQATNFQEAHDDNLSTIAFADGLWVMFDYNRGYAPDIESSGCMDLFRLPKLSHAFFRTQRSAEERVAGTPVGPVVFIASWWTADSPTDVRVFANCDEVELRLNGEVVGRRGPDRDRISERLSRPPFTFAVGSFRPGALEAVGYIDGQEVARHEVRTPLAATRLDLALDEHSRVFAADVKDVAFVHAALRDRQDTLVANAWENVFFGATGPVALVGANPFSSEAGIASNLVQAEAARPRAAVYALAIVVEGDRLRILADGVSAGGDVEPWKIRFTTDGSEPGPASTSYTGPMAASPRVRATLFVGGAGIVSADTEVEKFRIPGSTAPQGDQ